jgi:hypothetical protein
VNEGLVWRDANAFSSYPFPTRPASPAHSIRGARLPASTPKAVKNARIFEKLYASHCLRADPLLSKPNVRAVAVGSEEAQ